MIDTKELRRLTQAATPGPWYVGSGIYEGRNIYSVVSVTDAEGFTYQPVVATVEDNDTQLWSENTSFIAAANPAAINELLSRLEAAESERLEQARLNGMGSEREAALMAKLEAAEKDIAVKEEVIDSLAAVVKRLDAQCDAAERERDECNRRRLEAADHFAAQTALMKEQIEILRTKVAEMEKQEPIGTTGGMPGTTGFTMACFHADKVPIGSKLYALPGAQQCKNCNGMGDRFDPSGEKIPCDLCESNLEEIRVLVAEAAHDIISGSDFWLSTSLAAKKIYALPGAQPAPSVPDISDDMIEAIESRAEQGYRRHHGSIRGQQITPADAISWHIIHATRSALVEAMETSRAP